MLLLSGQEIPNAIVDSRLDDRLRYQLPNALRKASGASAVPVRDAIRWIALQDESVFEFGLAYASRQTLTPTSINAEGASEMVLLSTREIPEELFELIIAHLAGDAATLRACSLVCRSFTPSSQRHLFHRLSIVRACDSDIGSPGATKYYVDHYTRLLRDIPMQLQYIRSLSLQVSGDKSCTVIITTILQRLVNLNRMVLNCFSYSPDDKKLLQLCSKPTVTHISMFGGDGVPADFLRGCASLQNLAILNANIAPPEASELEPASLQVSPKSFLIFVLGNRDTYDWLQSPRCPVNFRNLNALGIGTAYEGDFVGCAIPLVRLSTSVEVLAVKPSYQFTKPLGDFDGDTLPLLDLDLLPCLTCLTLSFFEMPEENVTMISWVVAQLSKLPANNHLTELQIWIHNSDDSENAQNDDHFETWSRHWERLDDVLSSSKFDNLQHVFFDISRVIYPEFFLNSIYGLMQKTRQRRALYVVDSMQDQSWRQRDAIASSTLSEDFEERILAVRQQAKAFFDAPTSYT
ncbi:hypothetical protein AX16_010864 [Volvariella volvacea WC 439]|nr:hypothetical protein AX16_010864 [Volvariella volvacea WC 439]